VISHVSNCYSRNVDAFAHGSDSLVFVVFSISTFYDYALQVSIISLFYDYALQVSTILNILCLCFLCICLLFCLLNIDHLNSIVIYW
jgi:hypothetical protein